MTQSKVPANRIAAEQAAERLEEIREEMLLLLEEAIRIVRRHGDNTTWQRARAYWYGNIAACLGHSDYSSRHDTTITTTVQDLNGESEEDEEDSQEESE